MHEWIIYIPNEGDWNISAMSRRGKRKPKTKAEARTIYLQWARRQRLPKNSTIGSRKRYIKKGTKQYVNTRTNRRTEK